MFFDYLSTQASSQETASDTDGTIRTLVQFDFNLMGICTEIEVVQFVHFYPILTIQVTQSW